MFITFSFIDQYFFIYDLIALKQLSGPFPFWAEFIGTIVFGILGGLGGGYILVFKMGSRYRRKSFAFGIVNSGLMFIIHICGTDNFGLFTIDFVYFSLPWKSILCLIQVSNNVLFNILSPSFFISVFLFGFLVSCTQFMLQVSDKFGPGILWKFLPASITTRGRKKGFLCSSISGLRQPLPKK